MIESFLHMHIGWPQGLFLSLMILGLIDVVNKGDVKEFMYTIASVIVQLGLLYLGGFFG